MNNLTVVLIAVIAVLGGFYGGFRYESGKVATTASAAATPATTGGTGRTGNGTGTFPGGGAGGGAGFGGGRGNAGTITNLTSTGFTLHSANGTDTKVTFAPSATVRKTVAGQLTDLTNTATVTVTGTRDASGNLVATTITIVPVPAASPAG
jgi:YD repeat-containing protein